MTVRKPKLNVEGDEPDMPAPTAIDSQSIEYQDRPAFFGDAGLPVWLPGTLTPLEGGGYVITKPSGGVVSVQPNGTYEERPADTAGPWEICHPASGINALLYSGTGITFAVVYVAAAEELLLFAPADTGGFTPPPLEARADIRGAMWTARLALPYGPRPGQPDNCICIAYFANYSPLDRLRIIEAYGAEGRGYTSAPMGPICDAGYHGELPMADWRTNFDTYLDAAEQLERAGIKVVHFLRPDRGCFGLEWTVEDLDRELTPLFSQPRAQAIMHTVCLGWEPGPRYYYNNAWWIDMCQWQARVFPHALRTLHMVSDCDAPTGQNDDELGLTNPQCWANVAPYLHGFLDQTAGYFSKEGGGEWHHEDPGFPAHFEEFKKNFANRYEDFFKRFQEGKAGWPTFSAWGDRGILVYAAEYAAYPNYWYNWPEEESRDLGALALMSKVAGYLDGGWT